MPTPSMTGTNYISQTVAEFFAVQPDRYVHSELVDEILNHINTTAPEAWDDLVSLTKKNHVELLLRNHLHASRRRNRLTELNALARARGDSLRTTGNIGDARYSTKGSVFATVRVMTKAEVLAKIRQLDTMTTGIDRRRSWFQTIADALVTDDQAVGDVWTDEALNESWQLLQP